MLKLKRILCPVDFSECSEDVYRYAMSLAHHFGAELYVQNVVELWRHSTLSLAPIEGYEQFRNHVQDLSRRELREFVMNIPFMGVRPNCVAREGVAADSILAFAEGEQIDLLVMGTHGRRGLDLLMTGPVAERVLRKSQCPVLVVRGSTRNSRQASGPQDSTPAGGVFFCTDFSENSQRAFDYAIYLARECNSELILAHVLEAPLQPTDLAEKMAAASGRLEGLMPLTPQRLPKHRTLVRVGKPYQQILALGVETNCTPLVMGVHGADASNPSLFGSTTHRVIQLASFPVLAVHT